MFTSCQDESLYRFSSRLLKRAKRCKTKIFHTRIFTMFHRQNYSTNTTCVMITTHTIAVSREHKPSEATWREFLQLKFSHATFELSSSHTFCNCFHSILSSSPPKSSLKFQPSYELKIKYENATCVLKLLFMMSFNCRIMLESAVVWKLFKVYKRRLLEVRIWEKSSIIKVIFRAEKKHFSSFL